MKSPASSYGRRSSKSTPDHHQRYYNNYHNSPAPSTSYSDVSSVKKPRNPLAVAVNSLAGIFFSCLTPPDDTVNNNSSVISFDSRATPSVMSNASGRGKERRISSSSYSSDRATSNRSGIYNQSAKKEPGDYAGFTMEEIFKATGNFSPSFKIGQGGFGTVYKGRLFDGSLVAVKRAKKSVYDNHSGVEFQSEVRTLAQVEHLNLVRFLGYLEHGDERIIVVEYVPNGTLREHLDCIHGDGLDLAARLDIAIDVAHAITYLHMYADHPIIHRDIKSSNILLTDKLRAKVADFGFARLGAESDATHVSTQVKGTAGYLDPEYLKTYQLTDKSDVYSFGVLLVELISGRRPIEPKRGFKERITPRWAMKLFVEGNAIAVLDPKLENNRANNLALEKILELSLQCLAPHRQSRPSMRRCAEILWNIRKDYKELSASEFQSVSSGSRSTSVNEERGYS
ncbi:hypothetical protein ACFE04_017083 [Oxalis oulophora]